MEFDYAQIPLSESDMYSIICELLKNNTENTSDSESVETWKVVIIPMKTAQMIQWVLKKQQKNERLFKKIIRIIWFNYEFSNGYWSKE